MLPFADLRKEVVDKSRPREEEGELELKSEEAANLTKTKDTPGPVTSGQLVRDQKMKEEKMEKAGSLRKSKGIRDPVMSMEEERDPKMKEKEGMEKAASMKQGRNMLGLVTSMKEERNLGMEEAIKAVMITDGMTVLVTSEEEEKRLEMKQGEVEGRKKSKEVEKTRDRVNLTEIDG